MLWKLKLPTKSTYFSSAAISPSQMLNELFEYAAIIGRLNGTSSLDDYYTVWTVKFFLSMCCVYGTLFLAFYDISHHRDDVERSIFNLIMIAAGFQTNAKLYTFIIMRHKNVQLKVRCEKFLTNINTEKSAKIYENYFMILAHITISMVIWFICAFIFIVSFPIIYFIFTRERILIFGLEIPFTDWKNSLIGYALNYSYQTYIFYIFSISVTATTFLIICFLINALAQYEIIIMLLNDLNEMIVANKNGSNDKEIKLMIKLIVKMHLELIEYLELLEETFNPHFFLDLTGLVTMNVITIFAILSVNFIPGYGLMTETAFQIFMPCLLGTVLVDKGDKLYDELYNISWHLLSVSDQKSVIFMQQHMIEPRALYAGLTILDLNTFVELYKAIYSYTMILDNLK